jgi:hypothetical protein
MTVDSTAAGHVAHIATRISHLQSDAWAAWNASYHDPLPDAYRTVSLALYRQAMGERIQALFARLDEQNSELDVLLRSRTGARNRGGGAASLAYRLQPVRAGGWHHKD